MSDIVYFDKYDAGGACHWAECDRRYANWKRYNPALDARYESQRARSGAWACAAACWMSGAATES